MIKKLFKGWNLFEVIFLIALFVLPIIFTITFNGTIIECITTISYLLSAFLMAKGKSISYPISIIGLFFYAYVSFTTQYYGEIIISLAILLPIQFLGIVDWLKNQRTDETHGKIVIVNEVPKKEIIALVFSQVILTVVYYFILKAFDTNFLIVSTLSLTTAIIASYMLARRSRYSFLFFLVNDVILIILWTSVVLGGELNYLTTLLMPVMLLINDVYSLINWNIFEKSQQKTLK